LVLEVPAVYAGAAHRESLPIMRIASLILGTALVGALAGCGSSTPSQPNPSPTPIVTPTPTPTPTPSGIVLPPGMVCSPTPPPLYGVTVSVFDASGSRIILDSKPVVMNVDDYCSRVGIGSGKFCDTRLEGDPQRRACDYLMTGISPATGRWGPTWTWNDKPCGSELSDATFTSCANHSSNQFMAIAKTTGTYMACVSSEVPIAPGGSACGQLKIP
jgi:hypothetical protein